MARLNPTRVRTPPSAAPAAPVTPGGLAALVALHRVVVSARHFGARTERALAGRDVVEQAKGVIAYLDNVPIDDAYLLLRQRAERDGVNLTVMAQRVLDQATRPTGGEPRPG